MQADEGVGLEPVPADAVAPVDQGHAHVGVVDQRVGERHPHGPGADHEVVGLDTVRHPSTQTRSGAAVHLARRIAEPVTASPEPRRPTPPRRPRVHVREGTARPARVGVVEHDRDERVGRLAAQWRGQGPLDGLVEWTLATPACAARRPTRWSRSCSTTPTRAGRAVPPDVHGAAAVAVGER